MVLICGAALTNTNPGEDRRWPADDRTTGWLGYCRFEDGKPTATSVTADDGSWAEVTLADDHGVHHVAEAGPRRVWRMIEKAHALWNTLEHPGWDRFGLTVTEDHQRVWLDAPTSSHTWLLPPVRAS